MRTQIDGLAVRAVACPIGDGALEVGVYDVCDYGWWEAQEAEDLAEGVGQTAENPYGMKLWPGGLALAQRLAALDPATLANLRVLELGAGNGLCSLACAALGCRAVLATDISERALGLVRGAAADQGLGGSVVTAPFDVCGPGPLPPCDLVLASDLLYEDGLAGHLARRCAEACARGIAVAVAGDPNRAARPHFVRRMRAYAAHGGGGGAQAARGGTEAGAEPRFLRTAEPNPEVRRARLARLPGAGNTGPIETHESSGGGYSAFFEPAFAVALPAAKWKAKAVEVAVVDGDRLQWPRRA